MGTPKAALAFGATTTLGLVVAAGGGVVDRSVIVIGSDGEDLRSGHDFSTLGRAVDWVVNAAPQSEQVDSVKIALEFLRAQPPAAFFLHPVDCPLATPVDYRRLAAACAEDGDRAAERGVEESAIFKPVHGDRSGHPILCRWAVAARILELPPGATTRDALRDFRLCRVPVPNASVLDDMDLPEDYRRLRAAYERDS